MNNRFKQIRKHFHLTQTEFGKKIGFARISVAQMESGDMNITERTINEICREFKVNSQWLTKGEGDMFSNIDENLENIIDLAINNGNDFHTRLLKAIALLSEDDLKSLEKLVDTLSRKD